MEGYGMHSWLSLLGGFYLESEGTACKPRGFFTHRTILISQLNLFLFSSQLDVVLFLVYLPFIWLLKSYSFS